MERNEETKPHQEVKMPEEAKNRSGWVRQKEETKDGGWKEWGINLLFNQEVSRFKTLSFPHPCISTHA